MKINKIDFSDNDAISGLIEDFCKKYAYADIEYAIIISPKGKFYEIQGNKFSVETLIVGEDNLRGSICVHNHPIPKNETMDDSFSKHDLAFAAEYKLGKQYVVSGERVNAFEYIGNLRYDEMITEYNKAFGEVRELAWDTDTEIIFEREQILKTLSRNLKGFVFYENV